MLEWGDMFFSMSMLNCMVLMWKSYAELLKIVIILKNDRDWEKMFTKKLHPTRRFLWLGGAVGFLNTTIGATGPVQGPFYRNLGLSRQGVVGTFAAAQTLGHAVKLGLFTAVGFCFAAHVAPLLLLSVCVVVGTWSGSRLLERVDERVFQALYRGALTLVALRLIVWDGLDWL